jgi:hypothetical protein
MTMRFRLQTGRRKVLARGFADKGGEVVILGPPSQHVIPK